MLQWRALRAAVRTPGVPWRASARPHRAPPPGAAQGWGRCRPFV